MNRRECINIFSEELIAWFAKNKRVLPWRDLSTEDPTQRAYQIWVSEVMLQQTQVNRVIAIYKAFLERFPTLHSLAQVSNKEVIIAWRGMGYNSRALRLRDGAKIVLERFNGVFPKETHELRSIKGIGDYTAGAIRNFAFGIPTPCIDTNIRRIVHRFFVGPENPDGTWKKDDAFLLRIVEEIMQDFVGRKGSPQDFFAALMDFGALVCTKNSPKWELFPQGMRGICKAYRKVKVRTKNVINLERDASRGEPGRMMAGRFVPNRIFRGRIVEALRDQEKGLTPSEIGSRIALDWEAAHEQWLEALLSGLVRDSLLQKKKGVYVLKA